MKKTLQILAMLAIIGLSNAYAQNYPLYWSTGIIQGSIYVRGNPVVVGQITITTPVAGTVLVHFDGQCTATLGDRIVLAASNTANWLGNDGCVAVYDSTGSFSHSRTYTVNAGSNTFYAVAENYINESGTGYAAIYGNLSVEFFASGSSTFVSQTGIVQTNINVRGSVVTVGQITINAPSAGNVLLRFDGLCYPSNGDRIVLATNNTANWGVNDGSTSVLNNTACFSHTRYYAVSAGTNIFYAVAQNYGATNGTGLAGFYGSLTAEFFPAGDNDFVAFTGISQSYINVRVSPPYNLGQLSINAPTTGKVLVTFDGHCTASHGDKITLAASNIQDWGVNDGNVSVSNTEENFSHTRTYDVAAGIHIYYAVAQNYVLTGGTGIASIYGSLSVKFTPNTLTGVDEMKDYNVSIYPNPTSDNFTLQLPPDFSPATLQIFNTLGELIYEKAIDQTSTLIHLNKAAGIYFVKVDDGNKVLMGKLVVE